LSQAWDQQCDIQQMEGEVWRSRTHGRQTKSADRILVSVLDYPAVGNVSKGGKNGIPIHGHAPYRSAIVVQRLRYPLNETENVTCDQSASRFEACTKPLFNVCKSRLDPINTRRKDVVVGFVIITASRSVATTCCGCIGRSFQEYSIAATDLCYGPPQCLLGGESFALSGCGKARRTLRHTPS